MTSTIALIEREERVKDIIGSLWAVSGIAQEHPDGFTYLNFACRKLVKEAATELTTLLERCEKAEAENVRLRSLYTRNAWEVEESEQAWKKRAELAEAALAEALVGVETMSAWRTHFAEQLYAAEAQRDEALKALEPFAKRADEWKHNSDTARVSVKLADLRAARAALETKP